MMYSTEQIETILKKSFPDFRIESVEYVDEGSENEVYEVNQEYIFRFPKSTWASQNLYREIRILPLIEVQLNLRIPHFEYIGKESAFFNKTFVGYKMINGVPLTNELFERMTTQHQDNILQELATFLRRMHRFPVKKLPPSMLETVDYISQYEEVQQKIKTEDWPEPYQNEQNQIVKLFEKFLNNQRNFAYPPSLIHNDISFDHIYSDPAAGCLTGIIDFGDMVIGDGIFDFKRIIDNYGFPFFQRLINYYQPYDSQLAIKKLLYYRLLKEVRTFSNHAAKKKYRKMEERFPFLQSCLKDLLDKTN